MVNCKGSRPMKQELCRYCRTQVCEKCFAAATSRDSVLQPDQETHRHVCLSCTRLHPEEAAVRSPERHRHGLPRLSSARPAAGMAPRLDSLSNMTREHTDRTRPRSTKTSSRFLAARKREQQPIGNSRKPSRRSISSRAKEGEEEPTTPTDLELSMVDLRRRRHTTVITPSSGLSDVPKRPRGLTARDLLRANATELQSSRVDDRTTRESRTRSRDTSTAYMYDFTRSTPRLAIRDATATDTKEPELSMKDLQDVPKTYSCDFTGPTPKLVVAGGSPTETNQLRLSTVDLRLPKYKAKLPVDTTSSALTPVSFENLAAIEAKLASVELELQRYSVGKTQEAIQQPQTPGRSSSAGKNVPTTESVDPADPEVMDVEMMTLNRTRVVFDKKTVTPWQMKMPGPKAFGHSPVAKKQNEPVDFHLSSVDLPPVRPRRHTATDRVPSRRKNSPRSNQEVDAEKRDKRLVPLRRKPDAEPIDFHLSTFDLKPRSRSSDAASPKSNQRETDQYQHYSKTKASSPVATDGPLKTPKYAKHDQCDLSYLDNFRSYTV